MLRRLKNLWAWSNISPHEAGQQAGQTFVEAVKELISPAKAEIVYIDKVRDVLAHNPDATLDDLVSR